MASIESRIDHLEKRAAESALIANLATDEEARTYNTSLASKLRALADRLRAQLQPPAVA